MLITNYGCSYRLPLFCEGVKIEMNISPGTSGKLKKIEKLKKKKSNKKRKSAKKHGKPIKKSEN